MTADLVAGDAASVLRVTVLDSETNDPMDLTGRTVELRFRLNGGTVAAVGMTLLDQTNQRGVAEYEFQPADLPAAGTVDYEIRLDGGTSNQLTSLGVGQLAVRAALA
jgi:hypothetical protein